jgi:transposase
MVALTNKRGEGENWFKSSCPTPDSRLPTGQQLMVAGNSWSIEAFMMQGRILTMQMMPMRKKARKPPPSCWPRKRKMDRTKGKSREVTRIDSRHLRQEDITRVG